MNDSEIIQRIIGVLTEAGEYKRSLLEDPEREDDSHDSAFNSLLGDVLRTEITVPPGASLQDIGALVGREMGPVIYRVFGAFALAFHELAEEHDRHDPEVSSAEVLRRLALKAEEL
ncbi:hypothetical protein N4P33_15755 [Streptomyces sp. 15-116A]|uniref:hypothetical protein n=1 Tax=Streptomyces sp. 15-116A TaxID=2259035 RepID=UPI0021B2CDDA|nr:hypothetical protein [Streptomyces sp. 15-116A]MCT7353617.1 hypothetical protein [Streptomyces sp. 15-116A]